jgi:DUF4097 and DUF4098 domain-containing protein YvlB
MKSLTLAAIVLATLAAATVPAQATEARFEKTLSISGRATLHVETGSGNVHLTVGPSNHIHIVGHVKTSGACLFCPGTAHNDERVKQIAANPPIEQTGSIIRVGAHLGNLNNISIDYDIEAPADAYLDVSSGSGDITDDGVGSNAKIGTGSGNIHANGLSEGFSVETGSGDIVAEAHGTGDVRAHTGSGNIELKEISGGLRAQTGSGDIKLNGEPKASWRVTTGSGNVELWPGGAGMDLDLSTGSGGIHVEGQSTDSDKHSLTTKVHGGGPTVRIETGSGDVRIH